jgi:hypothetical protein
MQALDAIHAGYELAGHEIGWMHAPHRAGGISCVICNTDCGQGDHLVLWLRARGRNDRISICFGHTTCIKGYNRFATKEPPGSLRGLALVCLGHARLGRTSYIRRNRLDTKYACFICCLSVDLAPYSNIEAETDYLCAQIHNDCLNPFIKERDRVINAYIMECAKKVWLIPLGDCRIIIMGHLCSLQTPEEVFGAMWRLQRSP